MNNNYLSFLLGFLTMALIAVGISLFKARPPTTEFIDSGPDPLLASADPASVEIADPVLVETEKEAPRDDISKPSKIPFGPLVTPTPTPTPPPAEEPDIKVMLRDWRLNYLLRDRIEIEDRRTREVFMMKVGQSKQVNQGPNKILKVTLTKLDQRKFIATFGAPAVEGATELKQVHELKIF